MGLDGGLRAMVDAGLAERLPPGDDLAAAVAAAARDGVLAGGKRLRPVLLLLCTRMGGGDPRQTLDAACGVELIHCASLVLDDLPCMDDAARRRGRPALHLRHGESTAILASVLLLSRGLQLLNRNALRAGLDAEQILAFASRVERAVGCEGLVGGQCADLTLADSTDAALLDRVHRRKTAALFALSARAGVELLGAPELLCDRLERFGLELGRAFQVLDDIRDAAPHPGADLPARSSVGALGPAGAHAHAEQLLRSAWSELAPLGPDAAPLRELITSLRVRFRLSDGASSPVAASERP